MSYWDTCVISNSVAFSAITIYISAVRKSFSPLCRVFTFCFWVYVRDVVKVVFNWFHFALSSRLQVNFLFWWYGSRYRCIFCHTAAAVWIECGWADISPRWYLVRYPQMCVWMQSFKGRMTELHMAKSWNWYCPVLHGSSLSSRKLSWQVLAYHRYISIGIYVSWPVARNCSAGMPKISWRSF